MAGIGYLKLAIRMDRGYYAAAAGLMILLFVLLRKEKISRRLALSLLLPYLFLVLCSAVIRRTGYTGRMMLGRPFVAIEKALRNTGARRRDAVTQIVLNTLMLSPIGLLMPLTVKRKGLVIPAGFLFSLMIETLQLIFRRGYFEVDDLIFNTLGVAIGFAVSAGVERIIRKLE